MEIVSRPLGVLQAHPLNARIYDAERDDSDFRRGISERGIINPLVIDQYDTILSGHRRWRAACALALDSVPVIVREIDDPLEAEIILIESNRQREKTASDIMREAERLRDIEREKARKRMLAGKAADPVPHVAQGKGKTRDKVAEQVGRKRGTLANIETVWKAATDETKPPEVRAVAQQQMAALDAKQVAPRKAADTVRAAEVREKVRALPDQEPPADPFADKPLVKAARLVKNARQALKATADHLEYFTPEEMADAVEMNGTPDYVTADLARLGRWVADYQKAIKRRRSALHIVS